MEAHYALTGCSVFHALQKAYRKFREVMLAAKDSYVEMYAGELEKFNKGGHLRGW